VLLQLPFLNVLHFSFPLHPDPSLRTPTRLHHKYTSQPDNMATFFDGVKKSWQDVPVDASKDNAISTTEFLEAAESLTTLFGMSFSMSLNGSPH
jgi:hypothetical protein